MWVKCLDVGKLEPRAEEGRFVGIDSESKGYRVYWPGKNRVSIERDAYFNEKEALDADKAPIEGETDIPSKPDHCQHLNNSQNPPHTPLSIDNEPNQPELNPETQITESSDTNKKPTHRNSLKGLSQVNTEDFGRGKRQRVPTANSSATLADVEESFDVDKGLNPKRKTLADQGGDVEDNWEWAMAVSGDEPSLSEALNGEKGLA